MRTLYDPESESLVAGAVDLLDYLKEVGFVMYLVSREEGQRRQDIHTHGIDKYFTEIMLVTDKHQTMASVRKRHSTEKIWVVGDRVRGEISAGNKIGAVTVWFKSGAFMGEEPLTPDEKPDFTITKLLEFPSLLT